MGNLGKNIFTIFVYLPYLFVLISIGFLCMALHLKTKKTNSKKNPYHFFSMFYCRDTYIFSTSYFTNSY